MRHEIAERRDGGNEEGRGLHACLMVLHVMEVYGAVAGGGLRQVAS